MLEYVIIEDHSTSIPFTDVTGGVDILGCIPVTSLSIEITGAYILYEDYISNEGLKPYSCIACKAIAKWPALPKSHDKA